MDNNNNQSDKEKIANRLKEARTLSGLSQAQTADMINLPRATISEIESGKRRVSADELIQFANMYRVDTSWILH
jgi:transcriptional regulator with XRE-family HTH domain